MHARVHVREVFYNTEHQKQGEKEPEELGGMNAEQSEMEHQQQGDIAPQEQTECRNNEWNNHRPVQNSTVDTSDNDFDDSNNCVNDLDNTPFATCIEDISIAEEIAGNGDDLQPFGTHVQEVQLDVDEWTANQSVTSPAQMTSTELPSSPNQAVTSSAQ